MFRLPARFRLAICRVVAALALAGFLIATIGMPVVEPQFGPNGKDISRPFPCMHSVCGCRSATACWQNCCCHTNREKLAWAAANDVTPPEYVVAAAAQEPALPTRACCVAKAKACHSQAESDSPATTTANSAAPTWRLSLVPSVAARKCQGMIQVWLMLSAAAPPAAPVRWTVECDIAELTELPLQSLLSCDLLPPTPPPKA